MKMGIFVKAVVGLACAASLLLGQAGAVAKQPKPKSKNEVDAVMAMFNAQDPDARIAAANQLVLKFADTEFKELAMLMTALSYQQKNDAENMILYGERTLEANPQNYQAMLMIAEALAQRTRENDLDREEKLVRSEKLARGAMEAIDKAPKPRADITDEQWTGAKKDFSAQAHQALGMGAMVRKKYDVAITELKLATEVGTAPDPATMVRLGAVYNLAGKPDEAIAVLDKVMAMPDLHATIRQFAQAERVRAIQAKGGGAKPAAPVTPPGQVEIKK
jgi:tetratricopeptide (TPR) repeat protein